LQVAKNGKDPLAICPLPFAGRDRLKRTRVLRGGSFNNDDRNVRCAARNRNNPNNRNRNIGFRVVVLSRAHFSIPPELLGGS
jgi:formylglycine-generating enzyme required for sulfatase activity